MKEERGRKLFVIFFALLVFIFLLTGVNAEKMWNFNNYTLNVSNDLYVGGNIYGNIAGLNSYWNESGSYIYPYNLSKNVGIGTATPQSTLNIIGSLNVTNNTGVLGLYQDDLGRVGIGGAPTSSYKLQVTGTGYFSSTLSTGGDMYVAGGDIYDAAGDLHVLGDDNLYLKTDYNNDDADIRAIIFAKNTGVATVPTAANTLMIINETGNVGIGTTSPSHKLEVNGSIKGDGVYIGAGGILGNEQGLYTDTGDNIIAALDITNSKYYYANGDLVHDYSHGYFGIGTHNPQNRLNVVGDLNVTGTIYGSVSGGSTGDSLWNTSGNYIYPYNLSKNVGIGTNTPQTFLHVNGTSTSTEIARFSNSQATFKIGTDMYGGEVGFYDEGDNLIVGHNMGNSNILMFGQDLMYGIQDTKSIGIGTNTPYAKLDLAGEGGGLSAIKYGLRSQITDGGQGGTFVYGGYFNPQAGGGGSNTYVGLYARANVTSGGATNYAAIFEGGNVGIGTSTPNRKLEIWGTSSPLLRLNNTSSNQGIEMITAPTRRSWLLGAQYNIDNGFEITPSTTDGGTTFSTPAFVVKSDGKIGIGTTTPQNALNVVGDLNVTGAIYGSISSAEQLLLSQNSVTRIVNPKGASYYAGGTTTGAIKITLPNSWTNTMMKMTVEVYNYADDESFTVKLGGYNYASSSSWYNTYAQIIGSHSNKNLNVRFGHDGSNCAIYIGETSSSWNYLQVSVTDFEASHSTYSTISWDDGWSISTTTSLGTITATESNNFPYSDWNKMINIPSSLSGSLNADTLDSIDSTGFGRAYSNSYSFGGTNSDYTTAQFVAILTSLGAFNYPYWTARGSWCYACNLVITDTGVGDIHLAGAVVEVMGTSSEYTIRITTPTTSSDGVTNSEFIYINNGADYLPGWRKVWNSANDGSGTGLDADLFDGRNSDDFIDDDGDTMYGALVFGSGAYINMYRASSASTGIQWYDSSYNTWTEYMAPAGSGQGPKGNLVAPSGSLVTSWAQRSFIENVGGYGWTFESGTASSTTPTVVAEIRASDGSMQMDGDLTVGGGDIYGNGNVVIHIG